MGCEGRGEVGTREVTWCYGRDGERLACGGWPVGRRQLEVDGLAGAGIRGEEVGGGWKMIGGGDFEGEEGEGQKWKGGVLYRAGSRVRGV